MKITEDHVSFETAKLLKEKGFDIPCDNCYDSSGKTPNESVYGGANIETLNYNADPFVKSGFLKFKTFSAPTLQMATKWLREVHNIVIEITSVWLEGFGYNYNTRIIVEGETKKVFKHYNSYEEAIKVALEYALENLI